MAQQMIRRLVQGTAVAGAAGLVALGGLAAGCSNDNAILTGPTPAGVSTLPGATGTESATPSSAPTTQPTQGSAPAEVVVALELKVRQTAGGCWESFAPGAPSGALRQDLWFASTASCSGNGWSVALQVFGDQSALNMAAGRPTTATLLHNGNVLVVVAASAPSSVGALLSRQSGLSATLRPN